jgi:hypothetical protein
MELSLMPTMEMLVEMLTRIFGKPARVYRKYYEDTIEIRFDPDEFQWIRDAEKAVDQAWERNRL